MRTIDWDRHRAHREQVQQDRTRWVGLLDENFIPFLELPQLTDYSWPESRGSISSVQMTMLVRTPSGGVHAVVDELVAENLGRTDKVGKLIPVTGPARLVRVERLGWKPRTMLVTHVVVEGDAWAPHTLTIHGTDMLGYLDLLPCPSNPSTWTGQFTRFTRDWVGPADVMETFERPRDLADMKMWVTAEDAAVEGAADQVIFQIIQRSLAAVHRVAGITRNYPYVVTLEPRESDSPKRILLPADQTIWQELGEEALISGVTLRAELWWPGDLQPPGLALNLPTIVFSVKQEG